MDAWIRASKSAALTSALKEWAGEAPWDMFMTLCRYFCQATSTKQRTRYHFLFSNAALHHSLCLHVCENEGDFCITCQTFLIASLLWNHTMGQPYAAITLLSRIDTKRRILPISIHRHQQLTALLPLHKSRRVVIFPYTQNQEDL